MSTDTYYTHFSEQIPKITPQERGWLEEQIEDAEDPSVTFEFCDEHDGSITLWLHTDEGSIDEEDTTLPMLEAFVQRFRPDSYIAINYACTCSAPVIRAFHGGVVFITADHILWRDSSVLLKQEIVNFEKQQARKTH